MKIKKLEVDGFRCLLDFQISFEDDITVIVGENDAGKSSIIDCLKSITQNKRVELDDFNHSKDEIIISIEIDNYVFTKSYSNANGQVMEKAVSSKPTLKYVSELEENIRKITLSEIDTDTTEFVKRTAKEFGLNVRANSRIDNLIDSIIQKIESAKTGVEIVIEGAVFPQFNNIQLDGRHFENVTSFFKEVFLREKQAGIWQEKVSEDQTIEEFVKDRIDSYSNEIAESIINKGVFEKIRHFLKDLTQIKIEPIYQSRDLNIDAKVKFLEGGKEINIEKKGDGTKRRITMALLEFKKDESLLDHDKNTTYLLDEPDTHLHVKAQTELLDIISGFAKNGNQVILTTHSPFIINAVSPKQIRVIQNIGNKSKVNFLKSEVDSADKLLKSLGIENTYLFFCRHLIIVEGETEENFIPAYFINKLNRTTSSSLIKIVNAKGITNIPGFARAVLELHDQQRIYILFDNDASPELIELIDNFNIPDEQKFIIGEKEFEDSFESAVLFKCWSEYLSYRSCAIPPQWTTENIEALKVDCRINNKKFSKEIRSLNPRSRAMSKPILGKVLGEYVAESDLPDSLLKLFEKLQ
jgi:putative ATP-dependent endonuclease of the OLD family